MWEVSVFFIEKVFLRNSLKLSHPRSNFLEVQPSKVKFSGSSAIQGQIFFKFSHSRSNFLEVQPFKVKFSEFSAIQGKIFWKFSDLISLKLLFHPSLDL